MSDKTKIALMALRWPSGPTKIMEAMKSTLFASSIMGNALDIRFLVETAQVLPDMQTAARFLTLLRLIRERMEEQGAMEDLVPGEHTFASSVKEVLDEAEVEARSGFRQDELEGASAAVDVIES